MGRGGVYGPGRIIIESCSTKIVLKQDQAATQVLKEAFNLSDGEEKFIVNAKIGKGILVTQEGRIPFYNLLSDEEKALFTTRPKEVTAQSGVAVNFRFLLPSPVRKQAVSLSLLAFYNSTALWKGLADQRFNWVLY